MPAAAEWCSQARQSLNRAPPIQTCLFLQTGLSRVKDPRVPFTDVARAKCPVPRARSVATSGERATFALGAVLLLDLSGFVCQGPQVGAEMYFGGSPRPKPSPLAEAAV